MEQNNFLHNIALHMDLFNTVSGGISKTNAAIKKYDDCAVINVWSAGVNPEVYKIILNSNKLIVYASISSSQYPDVSVPIYNQTFILPAAINAEEIEAIYSKGKLSVTLPYHYWVGQYNDIKIEQL